MYNLAKEINESIKKSKIYEKYLICKEKVESDSNLCALKQKMKDLKDQNCRAKNDNLIEEYYNLEKLYKDNGLVKEYELCKKDVYDLLSEIGDILSLK